MNRDHEVEMLEQTILDQYFPANSENQTNNINSMVDLLQTHNYEESDTKFIQLMCDHLCSFDLTATGENCVTDENEQSM